MDDANATTAARSWSGQEENSTSNFTGITTVSSLSGSGNISVFIIIISALLLIFAAVSAASNLLVLLSYKYEKKLRSNFTILIVNQAVADFMVSIIPMPRHGRRYDCSRNCIRSSEDSSVYNKSTERLKVVEEGAAGEERGRRRSRRRRRRRTRTRRTKDDNHDDDKYDDRK